MKIRTISKCDHLKGNWFQWYAIRYNDDGSKSEGTVQADGSGEMIAEETFEADEEE